MLTHGDSFFAKYSSDYIVLADIVLSILWIREDIRRKKRFLSGIARMRGGLPMPGFFGPLFHQVTVLKMAIFTQTSQ